MHIRQRVMIAAALSLILVADSAARTAQDAKNPRRDPVTAIAEGIRLLEKQDYVVFLQSFVRPDDLKEMTAGRTIDAVAREFGETRAAKALALLKAASTMTPVVNAEKTRADFKFAKPVEGEAVLSMRKIGDYWYIR